MSDVSSENTKQVLTRFEAFLADVSSTNANKEKISRVASYADLREYLWFLYAPLVTFGVTRNALEKYETNRSANRKAQPNKESPAPKRRKKTATTSVPIQTEAPPDTIIGLFRALSKRSLTGHAALEACLALRDRFPEHAETVMRLVGRDLKTRLGKRLLNSAFGDDFISEFKVSLGYDFSAGEKQFDASIAKGDKWCMSRKFDGVRVVVKFNRDRAEVFSRDGHPLPALKYLGSRMQWAAHNFGLTYNPDDVWVADGEVCVMDENGNESFKDAVSQVKRQSVLMTRMSYKIFDFLTEAEFDSGTSAATLSERYARCRQALVDSLFHDAGRECCNLATIPREYDHIPDRAETVIKISLVEQTPWSPEAQAEFEKLVAAKGWEGIILRREAPYVGKRTKDILKIKRFHTEEYQVLDIERGTMRMINPKTGLEESTETMTAAVISHKGERVTVGSGWSHAQRNEFFANPSAIIGSTIGVQYFEETRDKNGKISLRFPTVRHIWGAERDA